MKFISLGDYNKLPENNRMPKQRKKSDFPNKICPVCGLSFTWRKKWAKCWDEVKYCSEKCRREKSIKN